MDSSVTSSPVPVTILAGFLGAGKTTLLNHILRADHGRRIAVLVNDFGAINIDTQLVVNVEDEAVSLVNGCICCTIRDDLLVAALKVLKRENPPDYLIIEASGVSDPVAIATTFLLPELRPLLRLDSILTVIDAEQVDQQPLYHDLVEEQIAAADIVVVNKIDLVDEARRKQLRERVQSIVPRARIMETSYGEVSLELLLGIGRRRIMLDLAPQNGRHHHHGHDHDHDHHHEHDHGAAFATWSYETDRPFALRALRQTLIELPQTIFRAKGIVIVAEAPERRAIMQVVGKRPSLVLAEPWGDTTPCSRLVFIGTPDGVDAQELQRRLEASLALIDNEVAHTGAGQ